MSNVYMYYSRGMNDTSSWYGSCGSATTICPEVKGPADPAHERGWGVTGDDPAQETIDCFEGVRSGWGFAWVHTLVRFET